MTDVQQRAAAKHFAEYWQGKGYEKGESQKFWLSLLTDVFGVEHAAEFIEFEDRVHLDNTSFIDGFIPATKVLIEQKSLGKSLTAPIQQSDGSLLSPLQQAQRYVFALLKEQGRQAIPPGWCCPTLKSFVFMTLTIRRTKHRLSNWQTCRRNIIG